MSFRTSRLWCLRIFAPASLAFIASAPGVSAQRAEDLLAGDSVRVDGVLEGRVIRIEGPIALVTSRQKPRCRAGEGYGDAPICDPAPVIRRDIDLRRSTVELRMEKRNPTTWTLVGGVMGGAAFAGVGYLIGPLIGFGKVDGCYPVSVTTGCTPENFVPAEELEARQRRSDQQKGAFFFGVIGGTASAILARRLSTGWVRLEPMVPSRPEEPWGIGLVLPAPR